MSEQKDQTVFLECVRADRKLRVRIISSGYNNQANCQFPRSIREAGKLYTVPSSAITFARGPAGKFFYRIKKSAITVLDTNVSTEEQKVSVNKIYEDENTDCVVCLDKPHDVVIVPCGHYCLCSICASTLHRTSGKCPLCRGKITL